MWHFQDIIQVFSCCPRVAHDTWAENWVEQQPFLFFATPQVKFQPLKVCCADSIVVGKTAVIGYPC